MSASRLVPSALTGCWKGQGTFDNTHNVSYTLFYWLSFEEEGAVGGGGVLQDDRARARMHQFVVEGRLDLGTGNMTFTKRYCDPEGDRFALNFRVENRGNVSLEADGRPTFRGRWTNFQSKKKGAVCLRLVPCPVADIPSRFSGEYLLVAGSAVRQFATLIFEPSLTIRGWGSTQGDDGSVHPFSLLGCLDPEDGCVRIRKDHAMGDPWRHLVFFTGSVLMERPECGIHLRWHNTLRATEGTILLVKAPPPSTAPVIPSAPPQSDAGELKVCVVCLEGPRTHLCAPCGHLCLCTQCANTLRSGGPVRCPICRGGGTLYQLYVP